MPPWSVIRWAGRWRSPWPPTTPRPWTASSSSTRRRVLRFGGEGFVARLSHTPVVGQLLRHLATDDTVRDGYKVAFAPGFEAPDCVLQDFRAMTYSSYTQAREGAIEFLEERPLDERVEALGVPALIVFGEHDRLTDPSDARDYAATPRNRYGDDRRRRPLPPSRAASRDRGPHPPLRRLRDRAELGERRVSEVTVLTTGEHALRPAPHLRLTQLRRTQPTAANQLQLGLVPSFAGCGLHKHRRGNLLD